MSEIEFSKARLLQEMQSGWGRLQAFIGGYSDEQLVGPTDAAGWTAKDHLMHLAVWAGGMVAVLNKLSRRERMQVSKEDWVTLSETYDVVNGAIQQRHKDMQLGEVRAALQASHEELVARVEAMTEEELQLPYNHYQPGSQSTRPIFSYINGNSFGHYDEHIPWMRAIMEAKQT